MLMVTVVLSAAAPLLTVSVTTYVPGTSTTNDVSTPEEPDKAALDADGRDVKTHLYVSVPTPLGFDEPLPSNVTVFPTCVV